MYGSPSKYDKYLNIEQLNANSLEEKDVDRFIKLYELQRDRIKTIDSKSIVFIGFFGSIVALLGATLKNFILKQDKASSDYFLILFASIFIIYTSKIVVHAIQTLERRGYYSLDEEDLLKNRNGEKVLHIINKIKRNYDAINAKVDSMTLAQEFAKRVLYLLIITAVTSSFYSIYSLFDKSKFIEDLNILDSIEQTLFEILNFII